LPQHVIQAATLADVLWLRAVRRSSAPSRSGDVRSAAFAADLEEIL